MVEVKGCEEYIKDRNPREGAGDVALTSTTDWFETVRAAVREAGVALVSPPIPGPLRTDEGRTMTVQG